MPTRVIFCSKEQKETKHKVSVTKDEVIFTCLTCESFVKFQRALGKEKITELLLIEAKSNVRDVASQEDFDKAAHDFAD